MFLLKLISNELHNVLQASIVSNNYMLFGTVFLLKKHQSYLCYATNFAIQYLRQNSLSKMIRRNTMVPKDQHLPAV